MHDGVSKQHVGILMKLMQNLLQNLRSATCSPEIAPESEFSSGTRNWLQNQIPARSGTSGTSYSAPILLRNLPRSFAPEPAQTYNGRRPLSFAGQRTHRKIIIQKTWLMWSGGWDFL